jgi:hypothetical protein
MEENQMTPKVILAVSLEAVSTRVLAADARVVEVAFESFLRVIKAYGFELRRATCDCRPDEPDVLGVAIGESVRQIQG